MKIIVDILMYILLLLEYSREYMSHIFHEIIGIALLVAVITHLILNRNYIKSIFKGKYNLNRTIILIVNIGMFICMFATIICGILSSQELFKQFTQYNITISKLHIIMSYLTILFLGLHLGCNLNIMISKIKIFKNKVLFNIIQIIIILLGIYSMHKTDYFDYLFGNKFFFSNDSNLIINFSEYLFISMAFAFIMYNIMKLIKNKK